MGLAVNAQNLATNILPLRALRCGSLAAGFAQTDYGRLLAFARNRDFQLEDAGVIRSPVNPHVFLTTDLCPSAKIFEKDFYLWVREHKAPIAISISGAWIHEHPDELTFLKELAPAGVPVTWVNHSLTHPFIRSLPDNQNFFLRPGVDVREEVLGNEQRMIENGLTPSVFFRFPGLISSRAIADEVLSWGLIPLGAEAWLALDQKARPGSIILVHGNGNEPRGIRLFFQDLPDFLKMGFASLSRL
jgi:peptidoglycan/xylan/chitin deacetylase (PgdA/CDA1 family)